MWKALLLVLKMAVFVFVTATVVLWMAHHFSLSLSIASISYYFSSSVWLATAIIITTTFIAGSLGFMFGYSITRTCKARHLNKATESQLRDAIENIKYNRQMSAYQVYRY